MLGTAFKIQAQKMGVKSFEEMRYVYNNNTKDFDVIIDGESRKTEVDEESEEKVSQMVSAFRDSTEIEDVEFVIFTIKKDNPLCDIDVCGKNEKGQSVKEKLQF